LRHSVDVEGFCRSVPTYSKGNKNRRMIAGYQKFTEFAPVVKLALILIRHYSRYK